MLDAKHVTGPARQLLAVTPLLAQRGVQTEFLIASRGEEATAYSQAVIATGCLVHRIYDRFPGDPQLLQQFLQTVRQAEPDLLQTHNYRNNVLARISRRRFRCPWIAFFHGVTWENLKVRMYHRLDRWAMAKADQVVTVSHAQAELLRQHLPASTPVTVIPNAVLLQPPATTETRDQFRQRLGIPKEAFLVGVFGRFSYEKGQDLFLQAFAQATRMTDHLWAILLGEGPTEQSLRTQAEQLGLMQRVLFHGYRADIARYYAILDALVLPSRSEGMPNVLLEAMTMGVPAVAAKVGGVAEIVTDGEHALLVEPDDASAMASALARLVHDDQLRQSLAIAAQKRVQAEFALDHRADALVELYRSLM